jgi:hypothetical protein
MKVSHDARKASAFCGRRAAGTFVFDFGVNRVRGIVQRGTGDAPWALCLFEFGLHRVGSCGGKGEPPRGSQVTGDAHSENRI